ncbi:MAG: hypothetical protein WBQ50_11905 [Nocardioides sp.]
MSVVVSAPAPWVRRESAAPPPVCLRLSGEERRRLTEDLFVRACHLEAEARAVLAAALTGLSARNRRLLQMRELLTGQPADRHLARFDTSGGPA